MSKPFRLGFVGVSGIANTHVQHLKKINREGVVIAAAADIKPEPLQKFASQWGCEKTYADYKVMLKEAELDAVSVCTPNFLHAQPTIDALLSGHHVLVEKPMAMNTKECTKMVAAARKAGKHLVVGFQERFSSQAQFLRRQVESGMMGDIVYVRVQALRRRGIPSWGVFGRKELQGGGGMIDIGVHLLEMAHYVMGKPAPATASAAAFTYLGNKPSEVLSSWGPWDHKTYTVEDLACGFVRMKDGASLTIETCFAAHIEQDVWNVQFLGTKGGGMYEPAALFTDQNGYMVNTKPAFIGNEDKFTAKMRHFLEVCIDGKPNISSGEDGLAVQQIIDGIYASAEKKKEVAL